MQLNYDYFTTPECKILKSRVQTNPRYKNFTQMYYTVGDVEQFWVERNLKKQQEIMDDVPTPHLSKDNIFRNIDTYTSFEGYTNISEAQVEDTFNYIFHKFKKGIYVKIKGGKLESFIPFSKAFYVNEWSHLIKVDPKYLNLENFFKAHHNLVNELNKTKYSFNIQRVQLDPSFWFANNCIFRCENPINEGENNYAQLKSMFLELCAERSLPDMEFFINRRDFPILTRNGTEPYNNIYGDSVPLLSFKFEKYTPILSMCTSDKFADIAIPTHEDWARIKSNEGIFFPQKCRNYTFEFNTQNWDKKINKAVFRGSNTGCGYNTKNNTRLKLAKLGANPELKNYLDVGITNWNLRIRKNKDSEYLQIPDVENLQLVSKLTPEQQSNYKYLIHVDGHVAAFRLSLELSMGCCILIVESCEKWKMWFSGLLEPYVHYVPIKSDLSDLIDQIKWCRKNDDKCKQIAQNSLKLYKKYLTKKGVLDNLQKTLFKLHSEMGVKGTIQLQDPLLFQTGIEHQALTSDLASVYKLTGLFPKNTGRNYGSLKGLERFIKQAIKPEEQITLVGVEVHPLFKSKTTRVILYQVGGYPLVGKRTIDKMKKIEFIHEAFIGKFVINNLLRLCPNFVFTLGYRDEQSIRYTYADYTNIGSGTNIKETTVLQEYINGPTLQEFLKNCTLKSYLEILLSLSLALIIAQTNYGFVHHDLKPWNIIINILPEPIIIEYYLRPEEDGTDVVYKIKTKYIPVIIDYGKSHVIYNNVHYGIIEPFNFNKTIDLGMLLISTLNELVLRQKENIDTSSLIFLANFLSPTKLTGVSELKKFLSKSKKFGNFDSSTITLGTSKNIFEEFFKYITPLTKSLKIGFGKDKLTLNTWVSNPRQIVDSAFGMEVEDRVNSYLEVVRRIYKNPMPQATNKFTTIMIAQKMFDGIIHPKMEFIEFATQHQLNKKKVDEILKEFNKMEKFVVEWYTAQLNKKKREPFNIGVTPSDIENVLKYNLHPNRRLFLSSSVVDEVRSSLISLPASFPDFAYYRATIIDVLKNRGPFKINDDDRKFYMNNFKVVFNNEFISKVVDIETIRFFMNL